MIEPALGAAARLGRWYLGGSGFSECCSFPDGEALLDNHSAQSLVSITVILSLDKKKEWD